MFSRATFLSFTSADIHRSDGHIINTEFAYHHAIRIHQLTRTLHSAAFFFRTVALETDTEKNYSSSIKNLNIYMFKINHYLS